MVEGDAFPRLSFCSELRQLWRGLKGIDALLLDGVNFFDVQGPDTAVQFINSELTQL